MKIKSYKIKVDYSRTIAEMIQAGNYDYVNSDINAQNFSVTGAGTEEREFVLFHFNKTMTSNEVIAEMDKAGYRPARLEELLALGEANPALQRKFPIIALSSVWRNPYGFLHVPYLGRNDSERVLSLGWLDDGWGVNCRFAAVCKS